MKNKKAPLVFIVFFAVIKFIIFKALVSQGKIFEAIVKGVK